MVTVKIKGVHYLLDDLKEKMEKQKKTGKSKKNTDWRKLFKFDFLPDYGNVLAYDGKIVSSEEELIGILEDIVDDELTLILKNNEAK